MLNTIALWIGYVVMACGGIALTGGIVWFASAAAFRGLSELYYWPWMIRAIRHYQKIEPRE